MKLSTTELAKLGVYDYAALQKLAGTAPPDLVDGLIVERSVNLLVGDSNLGKTPLAVTLAVAVASGVPFLGRKVNKGTVLYCDTETPLPEFPRIVEAVSRTAGLKEPPADLLTYSLNAPQVETDAGAKHVGDTVIELVMKIEPHLVVIDPLRTFWPHAQKDADAAMSVLTPLRKCSAQTGCAWLLLHHRRKHSFDGTVSLPEEPHGWMQESAGSQALVNHTDTRLGVEPVSGPGTAELVMGGFVRSKGRMPPLYLAREYDPESDEPVGYQALIGVALLPQSYQDAFLKLPSSFRFTDALKALGGNSSSNANAFLERCVSLGLTRRVGPRYVKAMD